MVSGHPAEMRLQWPTLSLCAWNHWAQGYATSSCISQVAISWCIFMQCSITLHVHISEHIFYTYLHHIFIFFLVCLPTKNLYVAWHDRFFHIMWVYGGQHPSLDKPMFAIRTLRLNSRNDRTLTTLARAHLWLGSLSWIRTIGPLMKVRSCLMWARLRQLLKITGSGKVRNHVYVRRGQSYKGHKGGHEQIML